MFGIYREHLYDSSWVWRRARELRIQKVHILSSQWSRSGPLVYLTNDHVSRGLSAGHTCLCVLYSSWRPLQHLPLYQNWHIQENTLCAWMARVGNAFSFFFLQHKAFKKLLVIYNLGLFHEILDCLQWDKLDLHSNTLEAGTSAQLPLLLYNWSLPLKSASVT